MVLQLLTSYSLLQSIKVQDASLAIRACQEKNNQDMR